MNILGHQRILELLPRLTAQTLLFTGPEGVGRRAAAQWYARRLNCQAGSAPCGQCPPCRMERPADYLEVHAQTKTKSGQTARKPQIRLGQIVPDKTEGEDVPEGETLLEWVSTYPRHKAKVAVIDGAHLLNEPAANALLKVLEEPPAYARLILVAPSRELVLPTLVSRSLEVAYSPLPESEMRQLTADPAALAYAEGAVGRARWALENPADFGKLTSRAEGVLEALGRGPAQTLEALKLLCETEGGLGYLGRRLRETLPPESPGYRAALQSLARVQDASAAYVNEDLAQTWLALRLSKVAGR